MTSLMNGFRRDIRSSWNPAAHSAPCSPRHSPLAPKGRTLLPSAGAAMRARRPAPLDTFESRPYVQRSMRHGPTPTQRRGYVSEPHSARRVSPIKSPAVEAAERAAHARRLATHLPQQVVSDESSGEADAGRVSLRLDPMFIPPFKAATEAAGAPRVKPLTKDSKFVSL